VARAPAGTGASLAIVWTFAAFGEEMGYRGYLLTRAADLGNRTAWAYWIALIPTRYPLPTSP
jgi:membrane protease YdiL (CAAX protease family)